MPEPNIPELFEKLPPDIREAIYSVNTAEAVQSIAKKYNLLIDKMGILSEEVGLVMLGVTHPKYFIPNLEKRLEVDQMTARAIAEEVNEQIFKKVRESLKKIHGIQEEAEPAPGIAFKEKIRESVFRTPFEVHEMTQPAETPKPLEIKPEITTPPKAEPKKEPPTKSDLYREPLE